MTNAENAAGMSRRDFNRKLVGGIGSLVVLLSGGLVWSVRKNQQEA